MNFNVLFINLLRTTGKKSRCHGHVRDINVFLVEQLHRINIDNMKFLSFKCGPILVIIK